MPCSALRSLALGLPPAWANYTGIVPRPPQRAFGRDHTNLVSREAQRACNGTTRIWDHASQNVVPAPRALVPRRHNGRSAQRAIVSHPAQRAPARRRWHDRRSGTATNRQQQTRVANHAPRTPNGLAFSCRARAETSCQNTVDLAREAVSCNAGLGAYAILALQRDINGSHGYVALSSTRCRARRRMTSLRS